MNVNAGAFRHSIRFLRPVEESDAIGNIEVKWEWYRAHGQPYTEMYAAISSLFGEAQERAMERGHRESLEFSFRWNRILQGLIETGEIYNFCICFNGQHYLIDSIDSVFRQLIKVKAYRTDRDFGHVEDPREHRCKV